MVVPRATELPLHDENAHRKILTVGFQVRAAEHRRRRRRLRDRGGVGGRSGVLGACVDSEKWFDHTIQRVFQHLAHRQRFEAAAGC